MRRHFRNMRRVLAAALVGSLATASAVNAQYPQYQGQPVPQQPAYQYQQAPVYPAVPQVQAVPAQQSYAPAYGVPGGYAAQPPVGPGYARIAMAQNAPPQPTELPLPSEAVVPAAPQPVQSSPYPSTGYPTAADGGCNGGQPSWNGYMSSGGDYAAGGCDNNYGVGDCCTPARSRQWFFGAYALFMDRDNPGRLSLTTSVDSPASYPYYPPSDRTVMFSNDAETDWQWGAEIRFGSTFGCAQTCGCQTYQPFAWEVGYWGLAEDDAEFTVWDELADTDRLYGMVNFAGLEYDRDGAGGTYAYRPINDYYDYQMPIEDPADPDTNEVRVLAQRVRTSFSAQNIELNFIRFPICNFGSCGSGCNDCGSGCNTCGPVAPRFSINGVCGVRYLRLDEDLQYCSYFTNYPTMPGDPQTYPGGFPIVDDNSLFYDISVDNELAGFQVGSSMCWNITCKWTAFCDTTFGLYNNHIQHYQRLYNESGGVVRFQGTGENFSVRSSKDDIAFLGEARLGLGYQVSCNWRLTAAYRFIGIGGVASTVGQVPTNFANYEHAAYIDSNESIILHGAQFGAEMKY